jgi:hypothetical protein
VVNSNIKSVRVFSSNTTFYGYLNVVIRKGIDTDQRVGLRSDQISEDITRIEMRIARKTETRGKYTRHSYQSMRPDRTERKEKKAR